MRKFWVASVAVCAIYGGNALAVTSVVSPGGGVVSPVEPGGGGVTPVDPVTPGGTTGGASISGNCRQSSAMVGAQEDSSLTANTWGCAASGTIYYYAVSANGAILSATYKKTYCTSCPTGYSLISYSQQSKYASGCTVKFSLCQPVSCPSSCPSTINWTSPVNGRQARCVKTSTSATCQYRCASGYYGTGGSSFSCVDCPGSGNSKAGSTSITSCYVNNLTGSDTAGNWSCTVAAYYQN